tara:strand:+ start:168 stop:593 length:426 start_codon:yes stop_codon:yes gene_type:complete
MEKKSKVVSVQSNGTWEGQYGVMYKYEVAFENGDSGEYSSKSAEQNKFVKDQETDYQFIDGKFPKVKPVSNFQQGGNFTPAPKSDKVQEYIVKQSSLKASVDFCIANGGDIKTVLDTAEVFSNWVLKNEKPNSAPSNDMPF